jgi:hypothetical protein
MTRYWFPEQKRVSRDEPIISRIGDIRDRITGGKSIEKKYILIIILSTIRVHIFVPFGARHFVCLIR